MQTGCLALLLAIMLVLGGLFVAMPAGTSVDATAAPMLVPTTAPSTPGPSAAP